MISNKLSIWDKIHNFAPAIPRIFFITLALLTISLSATGHRAETDEYGCHYDYRDRYHCH